MAGENLIVYYSLTGNTRLVAEELGGLTGWDEQALRETRARPAGTPAGLALGGLAAFLGLRSRLEPLDQAVSDYAGVFLGTPVWAGKTPPAINRFLSLGLLQGKRVWILLTHADEKLPSRVLASLTRRIEQQGGMVVGSISFTSPWSPGKSTTLTPLEVQAPLGSWLSQLGWQR